MPSSNGHNNLKSHPHHHAPVHHSLRAVTVAFKYPNGGNKDDAHFHVAVPARSEDEAYRTLGIIGQGHLGTGIHNTYLGNALPAIRSAYSKALEAARKEITARQVALGSRLNDPAEYRQFVQWASEKRTRIARIYRVPTGPSLGVGEELRDLAKYGPGGRTFENLVRRNMSGRGMTQESAVAKVLETVDKPNLGITESALRGAKALKSGGAVLFVGGLAITGYEIYKAKPEDRPELIEKEAVTTAGSMLATDVVVAGAFFLGVTGVGLIVLGVVAGVAGAYGAERLYYAHKDSKPFQEFQKDGIIHASQLSRMPLR